MSKSSRARETARRIAEAAAYGRPRNPTGEQIRRGEHPHLSPDEWAILRAWQVKQLANLFGPWEPWPYSPQSYTEAIPPVTSWYPEDDDIVIVSRLPQPCLP